MKKFLSILGLITVLSLTAPAMAAQGGPHGEHIKAGPHHAQRPAHPQMHPVNHRPHPRFSVYTTFGGAYRYRPCYDCRLGWDYPCLNPCRSYTGTGIYIRF